MQLTRTLRVQQGGQAHAGWLQLRFDLEREQLLLSVSDSLAAVLPIVISRARALFDLDAEPMAIHARCMRPFRTATGWRAGHGRRLRAGGGAVLAPEITVAAARTLGSRLVEPSAEALAAPIEGLTRLFPRPRPLPPRAAMRWASSASCGSGRRRPAGHWPTRSPSGKLALHAGADERLDAGGAAGAARHRRLDRASTSRCARCAGPTPILLGDVACTGAGLPPRERWRGLAGMAARGAARRCCGRGTPLPPAAAPNRRRRTRRSLRQASAPTPHEIPEGEVVCTSHIDTPLGGVTHRGHRRTASPASGSTSSATGPAPRGWITKRRPPGAGRGAAQLRGYFAGSAHRVRPCRSIRRVTAPSSRAVAVLLAIPAGADHRATARWAQRGDLASRARGRRRGAQPDQRIVPWHGKPSAECSLTGYAGGLERKIAPLALEGALRDRRRDKESESDA